MRGENGGLGASTCVEHGTSPRAWGKLFLQASPTMFFRNIPTCVGKTQTGAAHSHHSSEHPHVRGENRQSKRPQSRNAGTSPRAWGKPRVDRLCSEPRRYIPTCVGKTILYLLIEVIYSEHPHVRGENVEVVLITAGMNGTSPRAWGKRPHRPGDAALLRNIPTCVGKTPSREVQPVQAAEHPHVRGENINSRINLVIWFGTSPRAGGKQRRDDSD